MIISLAFIVMCVFNNESLYCKPIIPDEDEQETCFFSRSPISVFNKDKFSESVPVDHLEIKCSFIYTYSYSFIYKGIDYCVSNVDKNDIVIEYADIDKPRVRVVFNILYDSDIYFTLPRKFKIK